MESRMYQLYELKEELPNAITNLDKIIGAQTYMVNVLKESAGYEQIKELVESFENDIPNYENQKKILLYRQSILEGVLEEYEEQNEKSKLIDDIVTRVFEAIGMTYSESPEEKDEG